MATGTITADSTIALGSLQQSDRKGASNIYRFVTQGTFDGATVSLQYSLDGGTTKTNVTPAAFSQHTQSAETDFSVINSDDSDYTYYLVTTGAGGSTDITYAVISVTGNSIVGTVV